MIRGMLLHIVLALAAIAAAYAAWQAPGTTHTAAERLVCDVTPSELRAVRWQEEKFIVEVTRGDGGYEVTVTPREAKEGAVSPATQRYPGSDRVEALWQGLAPLWAARSLGMLEDPKLGELGLAKPTSELRLTLAGRDVVLGIGGATFGSGDLYARTTDGEVVLLRAASVRDLRYGATSLIDRRLIASPRVDIHRVVLSVGERGRELLQRHADKEETAFFADPAEPDAKLERAGAWMARLWRLRGEERVAQPPPGTPSATIELWTTSERRDVIRLWPANGPEALGTSERFADGVTLSKSTVDALLRDIEQVLQEGR
ncbi:MAG: DUF4340 domain-containing protein [Myxococcota bacterium]